MTKESASEIGFPTFIIAPRLSPFQSTADVPLCMTIFAARKRFADKVMWIMDKVFLFTNFGWVSWMHDDFFILAVSATTNDTLETAEFVSLYFGQRRAHIAVEDRIQIKERRLRSIIRSRSINVLNAITIFDQLPVVSQLQCIICPAQRNKG